MTNSFRRIIFLGLCFLVVGCSAPLEAEAPVEVDLADIERNIVNDYALIDPVERQQLILRHTGDWLRAPDVRALSDAEAAQIYTQLAFSSGNLIFDDPAFIVRRDQLAIVGLPNALGIYLFVLSDPNSDPLLISQHTIGLNDLSAIWTDGEIGVQYETIDADNRRIPHFALVVWSEDTNRWQTTWYSDNLPGWWFNALDGQVTVSADLQTLTTTGQSRTAPAIFDESEERPTRSYTLTWRRDILRGGDRLGYVLSPLPDSYPSYTEWLWASAVPSNYATLVEFIERLQMQDQQQAAALTSNDTAMRQAQDFGFDRPAHRYQVINTTVDTITVQSEQGTFIVRFDDQFRMSSIQPIGAQNTPTTIDSP